MSQLSREDMLRELELLPVWQLRQPLPTQPATQNSIDAVIEPSGEEQLASAAEQAAVDSAQPTSEIIAIEPLMPDLIASPETVQAENLAATAGLQLSQQMPLRLLLSDDGTYAFLIETYPAEGDHQAVETLLKNMIRAMKVSCRKDLTVMPDKLLTEGAPKLIISMGAAAVNSLLQKTYALQEWRSQQLQHQMFYETIPVLVTYHPLHLLQNPADKAHAWHDLCLAMKLMQSL
jgi:hypothetical protein